MIPDWVWLIVTLASSPLAWVLWAAVSRRRAQPMPLQEALDIRSLENGGDTTLSGRQHRRSQETIQRHGLGRGEEPPDVQTAMRVAHEAQERARALKADLLRMEGERDQARMELRALQRDLGTAATMVREGRGVIATEDQIAHAVDFPGVYLAHLSVPPHLTYDADAHSRRYP